MGLYLKPLVPPFRKIDESATQVAVESRRETLFRGRQGADGRRLEAQPLGGEPSPRSDDLGVVDVEGFQGGNDRSLLRLPDFDKQPKRLPVRDPDLLARDVQRDLPRFGLQGVEQGCRCLLRERLKARTELLALRLLPSFLGITFGLDLLELGVPEDIGLRLQRLDDEVATRTVRDEALRLATENRQLDRQVLVGRRHLEHFLKEGLVDVGDVSRAKPLETLRAEMGQLSQPEHVRRVHLDGRGHELQDHQVSLDRDLGRGDRRWVRVAGIEVLTDLTSRILFPLRDFRQVGIPDFGIF